MDWFRATFPYPDGGVLGTADFPSSPWRTLSGTLATKAGAATTTGKAAAAANQGTAFAYDATRARFKLTFTKADQSATWAINTNSAGAGGFSVRLRADTGELALSENDTPLASKAFGALTLAQSYFVQVDFSATSAEVTIASGNYASVPGSTLLGELVTSELSASSATYTTFELTGSGASIDDIGIARCAEAPPKYSALFRDTFNRASSALPGQPELPSNSSWSGDTDNISVAAGALRFSNMKGGNVTADQQAPYPSSGLRVRSAVKFGTEGWFIVRYNEQPNVEGNGNGFDLFREKNTNVFIEDGAPIKPHNERFPVTLDLNAFYFIQLDVDADVYVVTVRSSSYDGPILFGSTSDGYVTTPENQRTLYIGNTWSSDLDIDEIYVDRYAP